MDSTFDINVPPIYECDILSEPAISNDSAITAASSSKMEQTKKKKIPLVKYFNCPYCTKGRIFKSRSGLLRHEKKCHAEVPRRWKKKRSPGELEYKTVKNVICREDDCGFRCYKIGQLRRHLQTQHNFSISSPETLKFDSMSSFEAWKKNHELSTQSKFVRRWTRADGAHEYLCNRSGSYRSQSKGFRQPRIAGSLKSGGHCTARIILFNGKSKPDLKEGIQITFYPTHYGHSIYTSMNKRKIMQENKRKQRVIATALANDTRESQLKIPCSPPTLPPAPKIETAAVGTTKKRRKSSSNTNQHDFRNVIEEIESNLQSIKTMQTKSLAEDKATANFKLIYQNSNTLSQHGLEDSCLNENGPSPVDEDLNCNINFSNYDEKSEQLPLRTYDLVKVENSLETSSQTDETMEREHMIVAESDTVYGKRRQVDEIRFSSNNNSQMGMESHLEALNIEMDRLYSLKPYLKKIANVDDSTRILTLVNFVHDSIVEVLAQNI